MRPKLIKYSFIVAFLVAFQVTFAQDTIREDTLNRFKPLNRILLIFDASQSMYGRWQSDTKFNIARNLLLRVLDSLSQMENVEMALRVFGHQHSYPPKICTDTKLEVPFGKNNVERIRNRLSVLSPKGTTPIAFSLEQSVKDFPVCENCRNIIILITDGIEECGGDPCQASRTLQKNGVVLKPFIIGIGKNYEEALNCAGTYFDAASEQAFRLALNVVVSRALNPTTAQVNLLDDYGRPSESNVNMTFYDNISGRIMYNFIHTLNFKGLPDTLIIDPLITYDIVVHTLPPIRVDSVRLNPGQHTIIPVNAPQGFLYISSSTDNYLFRDLKCIIRRKGSMETVNIQDFGQTEKYITGNYNIEVLSMPRLYVNDVKIVQSSTTTVEVPIPGIAVIQKSTRGHGGLFVEKKDGTLEWVYNFRDSQTNQESLAMLPGTYHAIFRSRNLDRSMYTVEKVFTVKSGLTTNVKMFE